MSSIAQEESRKTSERVKWGQKRQMEQGVVFGRSMLGYDVKDGKMTINEEGAKIVRLIFHKFVDEGKGTHVIARELREEGIEPMRVKKWHIPKSHRNGRCLISRASCGMRNTAATWCRKRPIRPTSYLTKRSTTVGKRNLLSLKTITSRLSPVSFSIKQTAF